MVRVLLIDDNPQDRFLVLRELGRVFPDLRAEEVADAGQLAGALAAGEFDLVITDYALGWGNGLDVLTAVKARYPDRPVVFFTGSGNEEVAVAAMKAGLDDYVVKSPRHYLRLMTAVRCALDKAEAQRRAARAEAERAEVLERERAARAEAERLFRAAQEADRRKDEFLAMLAHELRNPLAPILNAVHLLGQPAVAGRATGELRDMLGRQVRHLARLVDDLLDVSRITRGKITLRRERVDLARLVRVTAEDRRRGLETAGLALQLDVADGPAWVVGDPTRLAQCVGNLLTNSEKFTDAGGRVAVRLAVERDSQRAVVQVEDTGVGIEPGLLPRVFEVFTQGDRSLDRSRGGLGLGLALVKGLVELQGGQVRAFSAGPGLGTTVSFWLPLDADAAAPPAAEAAATGAGGKRRILIIEDNRDAAASLRLVLELAGHEVAVAANGESGVTAARDFRPDVVLTDLGLPGGMNGYDVARALRHDPALAGAKLIAISGYGQPEDRERARAAGFDAHLTKPVAPQDLQRFLRAAG
jgi:signal transduction histidine kinase